MKAILLAKWFLVSCLLEAVVGKGQFVLRLHSYDNPHGTDYNGTCCDSDLARCQLDKCDFKFDICIGKERGGYDCTYGKKQIFTIPNINNIDFNDNILQFPITNSLKDPLFIRVNVTDQDTDGSSVMVDSFHFVFNSAAYYNDTVIEYTDYLITGERKQHPSKLNVSVASYCDQNYYGPDCDINCVAENFGCNGHYKCGAQGEKICNPGWTGADCDVQILGGEGDCGFYKDSTELLSSLWVGTYTCPGELPHVIQMNVIPKNADEIFTTTVLSFAGISVTTSGTYGYRQLLTQGTLNQSNITDVIFHGMQPPMNLSSMTGSLEITQKSSGKRKCSIVLNMQKSYFNQCGAGTCVRYGQRKDDYYCCCSGKVASHCQSSTTTSHSTTTSPSATTPVTTEAPTTQKPTTTTLQVTTPETKTTTTIRTTTSPTTTTTEEPTTSKQATQKLTPKSTTTSQPTTQNTTTTNNPTTQEMTTKPNIDTQPTTLGKTTYTTQPTLSATTAQPISRLITSKTSGTSTQRSTTQQTKRPSANTKFTITSATTESSPTTDAPNPNKATTKTIAASTPALQISQENIFINILVIKMKKK